MFKELISLSSENLIEVFEALYQRAFQLALAEGASETQARTFAAWCATLAGFAEPHSLPKPLHVQGLNVLFARTAWGPGNEHYLPRLDAMRQVEGDYETAFRAVLDLIKRKV